MRDPSCSTSGVKKIWPRITIAAYIPSSLSAISRSSSSGNRSFCGAASRNSLTSVIGMSFIWSSSMPIFWSPSGNVGSFAFFVRRNRFRPPPTRATPTSPCRETSMTSIPHSCVSCVFSEPSVFMLQRFATPETSEMKKIFSGYALVVTGFHDPRVVHSGGVRIVASASPSHHRHNRLCSPPSYRFVLEVCLSG
jgi:hypothetical protein